MNISRKPSDIAVKELLASAQLPIVDITPNHMEYFFGAWSGSKLDGAVGLEPCGTVALLRSLVVAASRRGSGLGSMLLVQAEQYAAERKIESLFLLTTTAESFFEKHGYSTISRERVPEAIRNTEEFMSICPANSVLMVKHL